jgi:hypothetical protein
MQFKRITVFNPVITYSAPRLKFVKIYLCSLCWQYWSVSGDEGCQVPEWAGATQHLLCSILQVFSPCRDLLYWKVRVMSHIITAGLSVQISSLSGYTVPQLGRSRSVSISKPFWVDMTLLHGNLMFTSDYMFIQHIAWALGLQPCGAR